MINFEGKVVLITGATGGIGRTVAQQFHALGATWALTDISREALRAFQEELKDRVRVYPGELKDPNGPEAVVKAVEEELGKIDVVVNNAGLTKDNLFIRMKDEEWQTVLDINLTAGFRLIRAAVKGMMKRRYGRIVSTASIVGVTGNPGQANYSASKAGLIGMTKCLALELASRGVTANCVAPGFIKTRMTDALSQEAKDRLTQSIPMNRLGTPEDVADAIIFLASDMASYMTGQTLHVNGGMAMI